MMVATISPLEDTLFVVGREASRMVFKFDLARRQLRPLLPEASIQDPDFSPDGKWMVFCEVHTRESVLWRARSDGSEWLQLTDRKLDVNHARFSHDGKRIAVMAKWPDQPWKVYWVSAGGGALHELKVPVTSQADPIWTRDDQSIIFGQPPRFFAEPDSPRAIYVHNLQTGSTSKLPGTEGWFSPRLAPDGRRLLALTIDEHKLVLYDLATAQWRILLEDLEKRIGSPSWSPDGNWAYANIYAKNGFVFRIRVRDGRTEEVLRFGKMIASPDCYAWSGLEGALLVSCARPNSNIYALRYE
jgi:Tol biopolymer transport system component